MPTLCDHVTACLIVAAAGVREAVQAGGPVDAAGRVQVAEEALSQPAPDLQRLLQAARHHRYAGSDNQSHEQQETSKQMLFRYVWLTQKKRTTLLKGLRVDIVKQQTGQAAK